MRIAFLGAVFDFHTCVPLLRGGTLDVQLLIGVPGFAFGQFSPACTYGLYLEKRGVTILVHPSRWHLEEG